TSQCQANRTWDPPVPVCEQVPLCPKPPDITHGSHSGPTKAFFTPGTSVRYTCEPGFSLIGAAAISCTQSGAWSRPPPLCQGVFLLQRGKLCTRTKSESFTTKGVIRTRSGLYPFPKPDGVTGLQNHYSLALHQDPHVNTVVCLFPDLPVVKCLRPPSITNGKLNGNISDTFSYGASVSYSCNPGYSLVGNAFINCTLSGTWSQPPPRCAEIRCVFPEVQGVKKGIKGMTYRSGTNITLECDDGYTLEGISWIQCQEDFSWDPPVPACKLSEGRVAAAGLLLLLGAGIVWKIISKQKQG
uniref:Sushi domain-containing protein n=1 Tax=Calidris pygmaea TaxID=425635 RepID=A0A8C3PTR2_9CHAR